jgi:hypothetical protein
VTFLQENDRVPETRPAETRFELLRAMAGAVPDIDVVLCQVDKTLDGLTSPITNLQYGVCESGQEFYRSKPVPNEMKEECGCCLAVDPFTINESCTMGCTYCYAADESLAPRKHSTTKKGLPLL